MNLIKDIRLFESEGPAASATYMRGLYGFDGMDMQDILQRLLFLLRHEGFSLGDFDHLYMNYTTSLPHGQVRRDSRGRDPYFPWFRFVDCGCDREIFGAMTMEDQRRFMSEAIRKAAHLHADEGNRAIFDRCYARVMELGPDLEIPYKEKSGEHLRLTISTTISDEVDFLPIIRIFDPAGNLLKEEHLRSYGRDEFIYQFRTITLGKRTAKISISKSYGVEYYDIAPLKFTV